MAYFTASSLLIGAIFLTHVFSAFVFIAVSSIMLLFGIIVTRKTDSLKSQIVSWLLPWTLGVIIVSPYLLQNLPTYFGSAGVITDSSSAMKQALLETRLIPLDVIFLSLIPVLLFFALSKYYRGKFITLPSVFMAVWVLIPALLTQSYLVGIYLDYERFLYFLFLPVIVCLALLVDAGAHVFSSFAILFYDRNRSTAKSLSLPFRAAYSVFVLVFLLLSMFLVPVLTPPYTGIAEVESFQVMTSSGYEAVQWIKANTAPSAVFVADANFGWWLSGFAQRQTLSAVDPQYLILAHEFEPARVAANLLETDYFVDNGFVRVKLSSPFLSGTEFSGWLNGSYVPYRFFSLDDDEISVVYRENNVPRHFTFEDVAKSDLSVEANPNVASFRLSRRNQFFNLTEEITVYRGTKFAKVSVALEGMEGIYFGWVHVPFQQLGGVPTQYGETIATVDKDMRVVSQIVFSQGALGNTVSLRANPNSYELVFNLGGNRVAQAQFYVGLSQFQAYSENVQDYYIKELISKNTEIYLARVSDLPLETFDYKAALREWNVSYLVIRNVQSIPRFAEDPFFSLVFKNSEVAVFRVKNVGRVTARVMP